MKMIIGKRTFDTANKKYIMGILNMTPDSFSDGSRYNTIDLALMRAEKMIQEGVDIFDIGGESTRPGYTQISDEEEIARILPIVKTLKKTYDIPLSVDTYKPAIAQAVLEEGVDLINDIWGLKSDKQMAHLIKKYDVAVCVMHNKTQNIYSDLMKDIISELQESIDIAKEAGIDEGKIMIDPGIGFAKDTTQNCYVIKHLDQLNQLHYPILMGVSRKRFIGDTLSVPVSEREEGTIATNVIAGMLGASFFRVHNVEANKRAINILQAIMREERVYEQQIRLH